MGKGEWEETGGKGVGRTTLSQIPGYATGQLHTLQVMKTPLQSFCDTFADVGRF